MNALREKRALLALAQRFGQPPAPGLVEEIQRLEEEERCISLREAEIRQRIAEDLQQIWGEQHELVQSPPESPPEPTEQPSKPDPQPVQTPVAESIAHKVARVIAESGVVAPEPVLAQPQKDLAQEIKYLREWVSRIAATGPGSGEVNLRYLDDVDRNSIQDDYYLRYEASTKKFTFDAGHKNNFHGMFQSRITQTSSATSATAMIYEITDFANGVSIQNSSRVVMANAGVYNVQFSAQIYNDANTEDLVYIWLRQNGTDVQASNGIVTVPKKSDANHPGAVLPSWNFLVQTSNSNEYVELMWFAPDNTHVTIAAVSSQAATANTPYLPAVPSIILTVTPVKVDSI